MGIVVFALFAASRIVITEVMANPAGGTGAHYPEDRNEFVELYNPTNEAVDLYDWTLNDLDGSLDRLIAWQDSSILRNNPTLRVNYTWLRPRGYAVVLDSEYTDPAPLGGYEQPYRFGDSCLILTTRNTTLGNGLAANDPLIIASAYGDTTTFGTPYDTSDGFPYNPGDGISWERLSPDKPDTVTNWALCPDPAGCTPGKGNRAGSFPDLAVSNLELVQPESLKPGEQFVCSVRVANGGYVPTQDWSLDVFTDCNGNGVPDRGDECRHSDGWLFIPNRDSQFELQFTCPKTTTDLWARLACPLDQDTADNRLRLTLNPAGAGRMLNLATSSFSPDQDGFEDSLTVIYRLPKPGGRLRIAVFDLAGRTKRTLLEAKAETGQGVVCWDGRLEDGRAAACAVYAVWLQYRLPNGDWVEKLPVVLER